ncbi:uncharacterized protein DNG_02455 [Cephalotrichum gorgonifer]|uniref:BZIP domain-containing protein n=1 Tax=Cephalotrichum gorgonifer TaxID=2041049 RepID=A0AAE8MV42_9PEZI|nr:uncharacterized protein DNG_02455 [Cephalotrichum gorgonifer]
MSDSQGTRSSPYQSGASSDHDASAESYVAPRTRQRVYKAPPPLAVPDIEEDAAERKRVLNVLAQRRYRQRRRQKKKMATTEAAGEKSPPEPAPAGSGVNGTAGSSGAETAGSASLDDFMEVMELAGPGEGGALGMSFAQDTLDLTSTASWAAAVGFMGDMQTPPPGLALEGSHDAGSAVGGTSLCGFDMSENQTSSGDEFEASGVVDPSNLFMSPPSTRSSTSFPDTYLLPVSELTILRAMLRISQRLNVTSFWQLDAASPFTTGSATPQHELPVSFRPTPSQLLVPHHPIIDILPWPNVREKLIGIMQLPDEVRPEGAEGPMALLNFAYDIEDGAEGIRIWGADVYDPGAWEVGQVLFERWWFLFDREIVANSNRWRMLRGASALRLKGA